MIGVKTCIVDELSQQPYHFLMVSTIWLHFSHEASSCTIKATFESISPHSFMLSSEHRPKAPMVSSQPPSSRPFTFLRLTTTNVPHHTKIQNDNRRWVPKASLSQALSVAYSGGPVGIILALLAAPAIITHFGWSAVFFLFGGAGLTWVLTWVPLVDDHATVAVIGSGRQKDSTAYATAGTAESVQ